MATSNISEQLLEGVAVYLNDKYKYIGLSSALGDISDTATSLTTPILINTNYNKVRNDSLSSISGKSMLMFFTIESGEPASQPVNLGQVGLMDTLNTTPSLGIGANLNAYQTKDNLTRHKHRVSIRVNKIGE